MKNLLNFGALFLLGGALLTSCGKTNKRKLSGEWKLTSWTSVEEYQSPNNNSKTTVEITGSNIKVTEVSGGTTDVNNGTVNSAEWSISKDGTWTRTLDFTIITNYVDFWGDNVEVTINQKDVQSGTWNFLGGVEDDFKKNERVVFNTLVNDITEVYTEKVNNTTETDTESSKRTYKNGENAEIFVVSENSRKELTLTSEGEVNSSYTDEDGTYVTKSSSNVSITLEQD